MIVNGGHLESVRAIAEEGYGEFADYYPKSASGQLAEEADQIGDPYYGRDVVWIGTAGRMLRVDGEYLQHIWGNIFDADKLAAVVSGIEEAEERVYLVAPYGTASRIDVQQIIESQSYWEDEGLDAPLSTGEEDLDAYLKDPAEWLANETFEEPGEEYYEQMRVEMEQQKQQAIDEGWGDLGQWEVTIRDGNHRAFGALIYGEPYVYIILADNQHQDLLMAERDGTMTAEQAELMEMLI